MTSPAFSFDPAVVDAVLHHMNDDHADDNLLITRAFGHRDATMSRMVGLDGDAGHWVYLRATNRDDELTLRVEWSTPITDRPEIRREIVVLYDRACAELGITPRPHE